MSKLNLENTPLKLKGDGDGIKNVIRSSERIPVPSSRKFTATFAHKNENAEFRLKTALEEMEAKDKNKKMKKSSTIAEITPTKSIRKNIRLKRHDVGASEVLHATPRPMPSSVQKPPSGRVERERRLEMWAYGRMLLFVWRRGRKRQAMQSESLRRHQDQISTLEKQLFCLKDLNQSECHKRNKATGECQKMELMLQSVRKENNLLNLEKDNLQNEVQELRNKLQSSSVDLENMKNEINTKNLDLKRFENENIKERIVIKKLKEENGSLNEKVKAQEIEIKSQEEITDKLNNTLKNVENHLKECEEEQKRKSYLLSKLTEQYRLKVKSYDCLRHELSRVCSTNDEAREKMDHLEEKLVKLSYDYDLLLNENESLRNGMENARLWKNAKDFVAVTWALLQNAAYIMLPAL